MEAIECQKKKLQKGKDCDSVAPLACVAHSSLLFLRSPNTVETETVRLEDAGRLSLCPPKNLCVMSNSTLTLARAGVQTRIRDTPPLMIDRSVHWHWHWHIRRIS